jgi:Zn-dependent protease with chaperone function
VGADSLSTHGLSAGRQVVTAGVVGLVLLVGFYVLALGIVVAALAGPLWMMATFEWWPYQVLLVGIVVAVIVARAIVATVRRPPLDTDGVELTRSEQPALWGCVDEIAARVGVRGPDEIRLLNGTVVAVAEDSLLLGLRPGRRQLLVGAAVFRTLTLDEFHAVIGHELGHYAHGDTRLGALHGRSAIALDRVMSDLGYGSLLGRLFGLYQQVFLRATLPARRRQELAADRIAASVSNPDAAAQALRRHVAASVAYEVLFSDYLWPMWRRDAQPDNLYEGFSHLLAATPEHPALRSHVEQELRRPPEPFDSHPSVAQRIAALRSEAGADPWQPGAPDSRQLVIRADQLEQSLTRELTRTTLGRDAAPLRWDDYAREVLVAELQDAVHDLFATAAWLDGAESIDLGGFLGILTGDRADELVELMAGGLPDGDGEELVRDMAVAAIGVALVDTGQAEWQLSWTGRRLLVDDTGRTIDLSAWLPEDLSTVASVLTEHVDATLVNWVALRPPAVADHTGPAVVFDTVQYAWRAFDLIVYSDALVLARARLGLLEGVGAHLMRATGGWARVGYDPTERIQRIATTAREDIVRDHRRNREVKTADIADLRLRARPSGWRLDIRLRNGSRLKVVSDSGQHDKTFTKLVLEDVLSVPVKATDRTFWG